MPKKKLLKKDLKVNQKMEMPRDPLQSGATQKELAGALLAAGTMQADIMDFDMGIHTNTQ